MFILEEFVADLIKSDDDELLFNEIMSRYGQDILQLVYSYVRNKQLAEDLTQDIFVKCYKALHTYKQNAKLKTWLYKIAANHCKDYLRSWYFRKVMVSEKMTEVTGSSSENVEQAVLERVEEQTLANAVLKLPMKYREVIYLFYFEDMSLKEIESVLGVNQNTVKSRLKRAKVLLREELEGFEDGK
ncbi:RNA polymerase factor sigma C [Neobacillus vireti LMG 21834]|uniref:RNA polymerase factor sigma C n=1 Tax=Neobacillus vireti LMG 21834 TaxID=1131730 RepID=A0AB94IH63_9BACI|nr:RNA polymerase factor sigma C [Neobacillus vireti LMG 21834]